MADTKSSAMGVAQTWVNAINLQDLDSIVETFATDVSFFGTNTKTLISDSDGVRMYFAKVFETYASAAVELGQITVTELTADSAVLTGFDSWKVTVNGVPIQAIGRISMAVALRDGKWKIVNFHRSVMPN